MTKDTEDFSQFTESVTCREYTLQRDGKSSDPEGWIRGNTKIGPVLEVTTSYVQGKCGVEIKIESINKDNSHSWDRISHGLNKLVTDLSNNKENDNNEQEASEMQFENFALKTNALAFASRSKAKAKPQRRSLASSSTRTLPIREEYFRVTGANDSVENYTDLFTIVLRNDDIQEFDSKWDGVLFSMTKIPSDDILEGLYKSRIRESEKLKTVLKL